MYVFTDNGFSLISDFTKSLCSPENPLQHLSENMLTLETKLAHTAEDPVVEVTEKVKHIENQKDYEIPYRSLFFKCSQCELKKNLQNNMDTYKKNLEINNTFNSKVNVFETHE